MRLLSLFLAIFAISAGPTSAASSASIDGNSDGTIQIASGDAAAGEEIYKKNCRRCHGPTAKGLASYPSLRDQPVEYLVDRLERYRKGEKIGPNTALMAPNAKNLSDEDILSISTFIASLE